MVRKMVKADRITYVSEFYKNQNFTNRIQTAYIGRFRGQGDIYRTLLNFDLEVFRDSLALQETKKPVFLRLNIERNEITKGAIQAGIYRISSAWDAQYVSWDNQPAYPLHPDTTFVIPEKWVGLMLININSLIKRWLNGFWPNYGLMIKGNEETDCLVSFSSKIVAGTRSAPVLIQSDG